jgi:hypothetical protein
MKNEFKLVILTASAVVGALFLADPLSAPAQEDVVVRGMITPAA